jgi:hypothetical protein
MPSNIRAALAASVVLAGLFSLSSCSDSGSDSKGPSFPPQTVKEPPTEGAAAISGRVLFNGSVPPKKKLGNTDAWCNSEGRSFWSQEVVVGKDNGFANVFIYVKAGLEGFTFKHETKEAEIDQKGCEFVPHVIGVRTHQPVLFKSDDPVSHNVNSQNAAKSGNRFNFSLSMRGASTMRQFKEADIAIPVRCDVHGNMITYVNVLDHPYFAVTDGDGKWKFERPLAPGKYVLGLVHERYGAKETGLEVDAGSAVVKEFTWDVN